jgi:hypothetical protein
MLGHFPENLAAPIPKVGFGQRHPSCGQFVLDRVDRCPQSSSTLEREDLVLL